MLHSKKRKFHSRMIEHVDLHTHSTASDGLYEPSVLLQKAQAAGVQVLALTDHDTTEGIVPAAQTAKELGIEFIPGIEINTQSEDSEVHVLGYLLDYEQPEFQHILQVLRDARVRRGQRMVEKLNDQGIHISWERVREIAQGTVARPHIAQALQEAGYIQSIPEAFEKYIGVHSPAYVPRYKLSPEDAIRLIASVRGLPVMAHPLTVPGIDILRKRLPGMCQEGLVGIEVYYGPYTAQDEQTLKALAKEYNLIATGGTDYHGPGIHPTPLGGRYVPYEAVEQLKAAKVQRLDKTPPLFKLPLSIEEK